MLTLRLTLAILSLASAGLFVVNPAWSAGSADQGARKALKTGHKTVKRARVASKPALARRETPSVAVAAPAAEKVEYVAPVASQYVVASTNPYLSGAAVVRPNPYLPAPAAVAVANNPYMPSPPANPTATAERPQINQPAPVSTASSFGVSGFSLRDLLPSIPEGRSILPSIKKVYPTGEKPLVVLTFHCPTELIGITPVPTKLLHDGVNGLFDLVNATELLSFNLQQVCQ